MRVIAQHGALIDDPRSGPLRTTRVGAGRQVTPGRLAGFAQLTAARVGKVSFQDRHRAAREGRCVRLRPGEDGMSEVLLYVSTVLATPIWDRLTHRPPPSTTTPTAERRRTATRHGVNNAAAPTAPAGAGADPRSLDQLRADLACELLLTGQPSGDPDAPHRAGVGIRAEVSVVIPVLTLLGKAAIRR